jgi:hypothetical protein
MKTGAIHALFCTLAAVTLAALVGACAHLPATTSDPDFSTGYEEGRVVAKKDAASVKCFQAKRNKFEGSQRLMKYDKALAGESRSDAYIQGFRMGFRRYFNYYTAIYCPDF